MNFLFFCGGLWRPRVSAQGLLIKISCSKGNFTCITGVTIVINLILARSNCAAPIVLRRGVRKNVRTRSPSASSSTLAFRCDYFRVQVANRTINDNCWHEKPSRYSNARDLTPSFSRVHRLSVFRGDGPLSCDWSP